jgi:hypothetical protein
MADVFDIILDRDEATVEQIMAYLDDEDRDVFTCYERFIARGIDRLSDHMAEVQEGCTAANDLHLSCITTRVGRTLSRLPRTKEELHA